MGIGGPPCRRPGDHIPGGAAAKAGGPIRRRHLQQQVILSHGAHLGRPVRRRGGGPLIADREQVLPPLHVPGVLRGDGEIPSRTAPLLHIEGEGQALCDLGIRRHGRGRQRLAGEGLRLFLDFCCLFRNFLRPRRLRGLLCLPGSFRLLFLRLLRRDGLLRGLLPLRDLFRLLRRRRLPRRLGRLLSAAARQQRQQEQAAQKHPSHPRGLPSHEMSPKMIL